MSEAVMEDGQTGEGFVNPSTDGRDQAAEPELDEFQQRVMSDPEFALEQIRKRDQNVSAQNNRLKALEEVERVVELAGGSNELMGLAQLGSTVQQNPALREVIQRYQETGRVELPGATPNAVEEEDVWIDEDVKKRYDPVAEEVKELKAQIAALQQVASTADVRSKEQRIKEVISAELEQFKTVPEAYEEAEKVILAEYEATVRRAEAGDATQAQVLEQLYGPEGPKILASATGGIFRKYAAKLVAASNTNSEEVPALLGKSTDARNTNPSRPGEPQLPPLPKGKVSVQHVQSVLAAARKMHGL